MIVANLVARAMNEFIHTQVLGRFPNALHQAARVFETVLFHIQVERTIPDHVQQNPVAVFVIPLARGIPTRKFLGSEKITIGISAAIVNQFFAVEQHEVDAVAAGEFWHVPGQFAQHRDAAGTVVCPDERVTTSPWIGVLVGKRPRVVVGTKQNPVGSFGVPFDDQVRHFDRASGLRMPHFEILPADLATHFFEVIDQSLLLLSHSVRAAVSGAKFADPLERLVACDAVERVGLMMGLAIALKRDEIDHHNHHDQQQRTDEYRLGSCSVHE